MGALIVLTSGGRRSYIDRTLLILIGIAPNRILVEDGILETWVTIGIGVVGIVARTSGILSQAVAHLVSHHEIEGWIGTTYRDGSSSKSARSRIALDVEG